MQALSSVAGLLATEESVARVRACGGALAEARAVVVDIALAHERLGRGGDALVDLVAVDHRAADLVAGLLDDAQELLLGVWDAASRVEVGVDVCDVASLRIGRQICGGDAAPTRIGIWRAAWRSWIQVSRI